MTTTRTSTITRRSLRGAALALLTGAGIAVTPLTASASAPAPADSAPVASAPASFTAAPASYGPAPVAPSHAAQVAVDTALAQQGKPYQWGGTGPGGFDCSGLTYSSYRAAGVNLPRTSSAQSTAGHQIPWYAMQPGDLIFFYSPVSHVGIAIGNGLMVHSSSYGNPVSVVRVDSMPGYHSTRRVA
ncbi:C40 family peptidase [Candidatus Blastococcus massiliensis]|uniref:C40 family peptidase n=1 Tax=Candidatus Blastococcus massiliensis TaxID=1470358 RepID=UPI0004B5415D|nr:NlpC/P60 family protein [Candidatus Blastococcus massiliensis]